MIKPDKNVKLTDYARKDTVPIRTIDIEKMLVNEKSLSKTELFEKTFSKKTKRPKKMTKK